MRVFERDIINGASAYVDKFLLGELANNVYVLRGVTGTVIVDPSCDADVITIVLGSEKPDAILITHHHWDHTGAAAALRTFYGIPVVASAIDAPMIEQTVPMSGRALAIDACPVDMKVHDGDTVAFGNLSFSVMETPGHTPGSVCYFLQGTVEPGADSQGRPILVAGDTLFKRSIGRTDFEGGDMQAMKASLARLATLPDATWVLPGHGELTTIGAERTGAFRYYG